MLDFVLAIDVAWNDDEKVKDTATETGRCLFVDVGVGLPRVTCPFASW